MVSLGLGSSFLNHGFCVGIELESIWVGLSGEGRCRRVPLNAEVGKQFISQNAVELHLVVDIAAVNNVSESSLSEIGCSSRLEHHLGWVGVIHGLDSLGIGSDLETDVQEAWDADQLVDV